MFFLGLLLSLFLSLTVKTSVGAPATEVTFTDVARQAGINFANVFGGAKAKRYLLETTGSGVAWIDYDRDSYPDLFLVNGTT
ncbi:MAG: RNA-binding protein, partial [Acidobacteria bacterium]